MCSILSLVECFLLEQRDAPECASAEEDPGHEGDGPDRPDHDADPVKGRDRPLVPGGAARRSPQLAWSNIRMREVAPVAPWIVGRKAAGCRPGAQAPRTPCARRAP